MNIGIHLTFAGQCAAAFELYQRTLGGTDLLLFTYGQSGMADQVPSSWHDRIVHANLTIGDRVLMGADAQPESYQPPQGVFVFLTCADQAEAERVFAALSDGGKIQLPLQKTFWSPCFGVLIDRFGTPWEVTCAPPSA